MKLSELSPVLHAITHAERRGVTPQELVDAIAELRKDQPMAPAPETFFCNKCGYHGDKMEHLRPNTLKPCHYLAASSKWMERQPQVPRYDPHQRS